MKKCILFLMFILAVQIGYKTAPGLAQEDKDVLEVKNVIKRLSDNFVLRDLNSIMKQVSINYSGVTKDGDVIDYANFKSGLENFMNDTFKQYMDYSIGELDILKLDIQGNKATVEVRFNWKGFNIDTLKEDSGKLERQVSLAKEDGSWKIVQWKRFEQSK